MIQTNQTARAVGSPYDKHGNMINNGAHIQGTKPTNYGVCATSEDDWRERANAKPVVFTRSKFKEIH